MSGSEKVLEAIVVFGLLAFGVVLLNLVGCGGSNIPIDLCEEFPGHPECIEPPIEVEQCSSAATEAIIRALIDNYERGFADGVDSVECEEPVEPEEPVECEACPEPVECPPTWTCEDFAGRPPGHKPIECRGGQK